MNFNFETPIMELLSYKRIARRNWSFFNCQILAYSVNIVRKEKNDFNTLFFEAWKQVEVSGSEFDEFETTTT